LIFSGLIFAPSFAFSETRFVINSENFPPFSNSARTGFEDLIAKELYGRLGISIRINHLPAERALRVANEGVEDGILSRIGGMTKNYPNLIQLDEPTLVREFIAFSKKKDLKISGWEDLKPYNVGIITGWKIMEWNIKDVKSLTRVKDAKNLFKLLVNDRVDIIAFARWPGLQQIKDLGLKTVWVIENPLATKEMFFYVHKKHKKLIPLLNAALRAMKRDGTYQKIYARTVSQLLTP